MSLFSMSYRRFSLRALLCLTTVACVGLGWWTYRAREQRSAVRTLTELGANCVYDRRSGKAPGWLLTALGPDYFYGVALVQLNLSQTAPPPHPNLTSGLPLPTMPRGAPLQNHELAAAVQAARSLGSLRSVWLRLPAASAAARADTLAPIFAKIDTLMICREPPGDEQGSSPTGLFGLPERDPAALSLPPLLPNLELLVLEACELNPADLRQIASCDQLAQLDLYRCAVRCNNLNRLAGAKSLQNLNLLNMDWVELPYNSNGDLMGKQFLKPSDLAARAGREQFFPADRNQRLRELLPGVATLHQYVVDDYVIQSIPLAPSR